MVPINGLSPALGGYINTSQSKEEDTLYSFLKHLLQLLLTWASEHLQVQNLILIRRNWKEHHHLTPDKVDSDPGKIKLYPNFTV
jgi:hypothetical protein